MSNIDLGRLRNVMSEIESKKGRFWLFGTVVRADSPYKYHLITAAPWLEYAQLESLQYIVEKLQRHFAACELQLFSSVVSFGENDAFFRAVVDTVTVTDDCREERINMRTFNGIRISGGVILRSEKPKPSVKPTV